MDRSKLQSAIAVEVLRGQRYDADANPLVNSILLLAASSAILFRVKVNTLPRQSQVTVLDFVERIPLYKANAAKLIKVPSSRT